MFIINKIKNMYKIFFSIHFHVHGKLFIYSVHLLTPDMPSLHKRSRNTDTDIVKYFCSTVIYHSSNITLRIFVIITIVFNKLIIINITHSTFYRAQYNLVYKNRCCFTHEFFSLETDHRALESYALSILTCNKN